MVLGGSQPSHSWKAPLENRVEWLQHIVYNTLNSQKKDGLTVRIIGKQYSRHFSSFFPVFLVIAKTKSIYPRLISLSNLMPKLKKKNKTKQNKNKQKNKTNKQTNKKGSFSVRRRGSLLSSFCRLCRTKWSVPVISDLW